MIGRLAARWRRHRQNVDARWARREAAYLVAYQHTKGKV